MNTFDSDKTFKTNDGMKVEDISTVMDPKVKVSQAPAKGNTPWKELSIGGTFGVLLAGGGIYASGLAKGEDEDALLAGAHASDSVSVNNPTVQEQVPGTEDPVMLDENGNEITPASQTNAHQAAQAAANEVHHQQAEAHESANDVVIDSAAQSTPHITINHYHLNEPAVHDAGAVEVPVNIMEMDDSLSFSEAFAAARDAMGTGQAFIWHGGVYGTFTESEWHSLSSSEQHEFTGIAVKEFQQVEYAQAHHQPVHFVAGDVVDVPMDEEISMLGDDDVMVIQGSNHQLEDTPEIITLDNNLDGVDVIDTYHQIQNLVDEGVHGTLTEDDLLEAMVSIVNDNPDVAEGLETLNAFIDNAQSSLMDSADDMSDYISDADTAGLI